MKKKTIAMNWVSKQQKRMILSENMTSFSKPPKILSTLYCQMALADGKVYNVSEHGHFTLENSQEQNVVDLSCSKHGLYKVNSEGKVFFRWNGENKWVPIENNAPINRIYSNLNSDLAVFVCQEESSVWLNTDKIFRILRIAIDAVCIDSAAYVLLPDKTLRICEFPNSTWKKLFDNCECIKNLGEKLFVKSSGEYYTYNYYGLEGEKIQKQKWKIPNFKSISIQDNESALLNVVILVGCQIYTSHFYLAMQNFSTWKKSGNIGTKEICNAPNWTIQVYYPPIFKNQPFEFLDCQLKFE